MDKKKKELFFAYHMAPVIEQVKPAAMFTFEQTEYEYFCSLLRPFPIQIYELGRWDGKCYTLFYHTKRVQNILEHPNTRTLFRSLGYETDSLEEVLAEIKCRIKRYHQTGEEALFPHEIGIFLGYPYNDVIGFMKYRGRFALANGYWKVYDDVLQAKRIFEQYDQAKRKVFYFVKEHSLTEYK